MDREPEDMNRDLMVDGNAIAGLLSEIFGMEMTVQPTECAHCGNHALIGTLLAFIQGPGVVLRCSACKQIVLRIVKTPDKIYLDARGTAYLRLSR